jgi:hypothetical protein
VSIRTAQIEVADTVTVGGPNPAICIYHHDNFIDLFL